MLLISMRKVRCVRGAGERKVDSLHGVPSIQTESDGRRRFAAGSLSGHLPKGSVQVAMMGGADLDHQTILQRSRRVV